MPLGLEHAKVLPRRVTQERHLVGHLALDVAERRIAEHRDAAFHPFLNFHPLLASSGTTVTVYTRVLTPPHKPSKNSTGGTIFGKE